MYPKTNVQHKFIQNLNIDNMIRHYKTIEKVKMLRTQSNFFYDSFWINKFINKFIKNGRKVVVEKAIYHAFVEIKQRLKLNPSDILLKSIEMLRSIVDVAKLFKFRGKRRKRKIILIPVPIHERRQVIMALSWLKQLILNQKKSRRRQRHINNSKVIKKQRGLSKSKKKTFYDRFQIAFKNQHLQKLISEHFIATHTTKYVQLVRRRTSFYVTVTNNRTTMNYRWA